MPSAKSNPFLSTAQAADLLVVSVSTVKRWVDEGLLPAHVTAGGHRKLLKAEGVAFARRGNLPGGEPPPDSDPAVLTRALTRALVEGRGPAVRAAVRAGYDAGLPVETLADRVIAPAMAEVGREWEAGRLDVWHEHR